jgi:leucyl aminopeptidase
VTTIRLAQKAVDDVDADMIALPVYKNAVAGPGTDAVAAKLGVKLKDLLGQSRFKGEFGEALTVPTLGKLAANQVLFVGLGAKGEVKVREIRRAGALVARRAGGAKRVATTIPQAGKGDAAELAAAFAEGVLLGSYRFDRYKASDNGDRAKPSLKDVSILTSKEWNPKGSSKSLDRAKVVADATSLARDLTNTPALDQSPQSLADEARRIAKGNSLTVKVLDEKQLEAGGFGGLVGVGRGSRKPPRLVEISYKPAGAKKHVALVGKGITFDSGGLDIKTQGMDWMKTDMAGAAVVLATMQAIAVLKPKVAVTGIICTAENMPGGNALHPGDVIRIRGGKTVEVGNTDAEGRLVMSDGIVYAKERKADVVVDVATLTGACMVALGAKAFGVFSNNDRLAKDLTTAAERAGEMAWHLPLYKEYRKDIDSDIADLKNIGGRYGGAITAALFLAEFAGDTQWAHLDIAGPARAESEDYEIPKGSTGVGVRTLVDWLTSL